MIFKLESTNMWLANCLFLTLGLSTSNTSENSIIVHFRAFDAIIVYPLSIQQHSTKTHNLQLRQK